LHRAVAGDGDGRKGLLRSGGGSVEADLRESDAAHLFGDGIFEGEELAERAGGFGGTDVLVGAEVEELNGDADAGVGEGVGAFEEEIGAGGFGGGDGGVAVGGGSGGENGADALEAREIVKDVLLDGLGDPGGFAVFADGAEGGEEDGDFGILLSVSPHRSRCKPGSSSRAQLRQIR